MIEWLERFSYPRLIQIVLECWTEIFLLILVFMTLIVNRSNKDNELAKSIKIPFTRELIIFYSATFLYNLCDIVDILLGEAPTRLSYIAIRCGVFGYYSVGGFLTVFFLQVIKIHIAQKNQMPRLEKLLTGFQFGQIPLFIMLAVTPFTNFLYRITEDNEYARSFGYNIWQAVTILTFTMIAVVVITQWKKIDHFFKEVIIIATVFPMIGMIFSMLYPPFGLSNIMVAFTALILFLVYEKNKNAIILKRTQELEVAKAELAESRLTMMLSQIQPHFIYNSMNAIMELCYTDAELAAKTIAHFSDYLRGKLNAFDSRDLSSFDDELALIKEYLSLEYADRNKIFKVVYDISCRDFKLPALTVQPLVENAVKHGIDRYSDASLVQLLTYEDEQNIYIKVTDNGTAEKGDDSRFAEERGIGIRNVTERLSTMCQGRLSIDHSESGTTALVTIPKHPAEDLTCIRSQ